MALIEYAGALLAISYLVLVTRRQRLAWPSYIASSLCYIPVFWNSNLYCDAALQVFFVGMGMLGWLRWRDHGEDSSPVRWSRRSHAALVAAIVAGVCGIGALVRAVSGVGYIAFADAFIAIGSIAATILTVLCVVENWWYWIAINLLSALVYAGKEMWATSALMALYTALSLRGLMVWVRAAEKQRS